MRTRFEIVWSEPASRDLQAIAAYIAAEDLDAALGVLDALESRANALRTMPSRGRVVSELLAIDVGRYRELIEAPYRIVYRIEGQQVVVVAVLDGRRDLESVLLTRLLEL